MNKKNLSRVFVVGSILIIAFPFVLYYVFHIHPHFFFKPIGVRVFADEYWFFAASAFLIVACSLQFPFREDEAWHCTCGYNLSYIDKKSTKCPECGNVVRFEWSAVHGELSSKTVSRLHWAIFIFCVAVFLFGFGILTKTLNGWAGV